MALLLWEDIAVGSTFDIGPYVVSREEILAFSRQYDPQPFHLDDGRAEESSYGGVIASGWQTGAIAQRLLVTGFLNGAASMGSPGLEALRWRKPVRPSDELRLRLSIVSKEPSPKHPDRGIVDAEHELLNQKNELVMSFRIRIMIARREQGPDRS